MDIKSTVKKIFKKAVAPRRPRVKSIGISANQERAKRAAAYRARLR